MTRDRYLEFGEFRLDRSSGQLWHGETERPLRAKSMALLRYLAEHPARLVTRAEILRAVWDGVTVSSGVVRISIGEIREALDETASAARFVQTIGRRGYRFLGGSGAPPVQEAEPVGPSYDYELSLLHRHLDRSRMLRRQTVFVTFGSAGTTALLERFAEQVRASQAARIAFGRCTAAYDSGDSFRPVRDFLEHLCQAAPTGDVARILSRHAPRWTAPGPAMLHALTPETLDRNAVEFGGRLARELAAALDALGSRVPVVMILEDIHRCPPSMLALLRYVATRPGPACLLMIASYQPDPAAARAQGLHAMVRELVDSSQAALIEVD